MKDEKNKCKRSRCSVEFLPNHGNEEYCSHECYTAAKKIRQKKARDGIKVFFPILIRNHHILNRLWESGQREFTEEELTLAGLDSSLCRHHLPDPKNKLLRRLNFGTFYLETEDNYSLLKLYKNECATI